jgi:hypothetical protein
MEFVERFGHAEKQSVIVTMLGLDSADDAMANRSSNSFFDEFQKSH